METQPVVKVLGDENGRLGIEVMGKTFLSFEKMNIVDGKVSVKELQDALFIGEEGRKYLVKRGRWYH
jgi:hypothetical protein